MNLYALNGRFVFLNHIRHISSYKIVKNQLDDLKSTESEFTQ